MKGYILDIETDGLDLDCNIVLVGLRDFKSNEIFTYNLQRQSKARVYTDLKEKLDEANILIGYNIKEFDLPIIENFFGIKFFGKVIDLYEVIKFKQGLMGKKFKNNKLGTVVKDLELGGLKGEFDYKKLMTPMNDDDTTEAIVYLENDLLITHKLFDYVDNYFKDFKSFLNEKDVDKYNHFACKTGTFVYKFLCNILGLEEKYGEYVKDGSYTGGLVMQPKVDYEDGDIYCLDFNSLYPHIMMMANLFGKKKVGFGESFNLKGRYDNKEWHPVSKQLYNLYNKRVELKKAGDKKEYVLKIVINTIYGLTANSVFMQFYDKDIASDCTRIGRDLLRLTCDKFEERGYKVLYGDTDSVYIKDECKNRKLLMSNKDDIVEELKSLFPFPLDSFDLGVDYEIERIAFFQKKLYMFKERGGKVKIKGLPIIKDNATALSYKVFEEYIEPRYIEDGSYLFSFDNIKNWCYGLLKKNKALIGKSFNLKPLSYYKNDCNIYYKLSEKYGDGVKIFIPNFQKGVGESVKYVPIDEEIKVEDMSIRSSLQELEYFCGEKDKIAEYVKNEKKKWKDKSEGMEVLTKWF